MLIRGRKAKKTGCQLLFLLANTNTTATTTNTTNTTNTTTNTTAAAAAAAAADAGASALPTVLVVLAVLSVLFLSRLRCRCAKRRSGRRAAGSLVPWPPPTPPPRKAHALPELAPDKIINIIILNIDTNIILIIRMHPLRLGLPIDGGGDGGTGHRRRRRR